MKPDGAPLVHTETEAAAHKRWLITVAITVVFGCFGAVMAYLSYAKSNKSPTPTTYRPRSPSAAPGTAPTTAPVGAPPVAPVAEPSGDGDNKGKPDKNK